MNKRSQVKHMDTSGPSCQQLMGYCYLDMAYRSEFHISSPPGKGLSISIIHQGPWFSGRWSISFIRTLLFVFFGNELLYILFNISFYSFMCVCLCVCHGCVGFLGGQRKEVGSPRAGETGLQAFRCGCREQSLDPLEDQVLLTATLTF